MGGKGSGRKPLPPGEGLTERITLFIPRALLAAVDASDEPRSAALRRLVAVGCDRGLGLDTGSTGPTVRVGLRVSEAEWAAVERARHYLRIDTGQEVTHARAAVLAVAQGAGLVRHRPERRPGSEGEQDPGD